MVNFEKVRANITLKYDNEDLYDYIYSKFNSIVWNDVEKILNEREEKFKNSISKDVILDDEFCDVFSFILGEKEFLTEDMKTLFFENFNLFEVYLLRYLYNKFVKGFE
ncbi:hypothetical protein [Leptotrichia sp. oral taxon 879]|uniref:hypothetical protein n=1 Tax=Leptotrichia sp. oral taxon 879 TaxID=1227267 RepID=UPI0003AE458F|nr:hypothetical protein [Leptotrichia sp. oral taxon 879]ERK55396.1 hypothetical protein HMPREF1552_00201 [Leptotrichia sp. oral taxon 879 str. F0557]